MSSNKPRFSQRTWWSEQRVQKNLSLQKLSELSGIEYSSLSKYLTGQVVPNLSAITKLCDIFKVNYDVGKKEFEKAHKVWLANHKKKVNSLIPTEKAVEEEAEESDNILKILYRKLSYEDFMEIYEKAEGGTPTLRFLYDKVDFDTFFKIKEVLEKEEQ
jgi:transcriptional regulator with XRE-family HTH domain